MNLPDKIVVDWDAIRNGSGYKGPPIEIKINLKEILQGDEEHKCVAIVPESPKRKKKLTK